MNFIINQLYEELGLCKKMIVIVMMFVFLAGCNGSSEPKEAKKSVTYVEMKAYLSKGELTQEQTALIREVIQKQFQFGVPMPHKLNMAGFKYYFDAIEDSDKCKKTLESLFLSLGYIPTPSDAVIPFFKKFKNTITKNTKETEGLAKQACLSSRVLQNKSVVLHEFK
ncbi:hypothetical protein [Vibrio sp. 399]|uniref:hypothetical protein n=1 Tax=Vibrio sp. 399 TaxID=3074605 RepID=UPI002964AD80|nr:hypothetical protein [Vibrio sp. 399]